LGFWATVSDSTEAFASPKEKNKNKNQILNLIFAGI
jgi:hypothetical protein